MRVCEQCGETALIGGYMCLPDQPLNEKWRCMGCLVCDLKRHSDKTGNPIKKVLLVKRPTAGTSNDTVDA